MDNRPLGWLIWSINLLLLAVLGFVVYTFLVLEPSPSRPAYVPTVDELPSLNEPIEWQSLDVHELQASFAGRDRRAFNRSPYRALSAFDYHRLRVPSPPGRIPEPPREPERQEPPPPTATEALRDLQQKVAIVMMLAPEDALVRLTQANSTVTVAPAQYVRPRSHGSNDEPESPPIVVSNLSSFGIPAEVIEIVGDGGAQLGGVRFRYTYRNEEFEVLLTRPYEQDMFTLRPEERAARAREAAAAADGREPGATARVPDGSGAGERDPRPAVEGTPDSTFQGSSDLGGGNWVIGMAEAEHVQQNIDSMLNQVRISQYTDPNTGETGVALTDVPAESHAARRGFRSGDIVKSINGVSVSSRDQAIDYVRANPNEPQYTVVLERQGREQSLTYRNPRYQAD